MISMPVLNVNADETIGEDAVADLDAVSGRGLRGTEQRKRTEQEPDSPKAGSECDHWI